MCSTYSNSVLALFGGKATTSSSSSSICEVTREVISMILPYEFVPA
jgi:hypothetical protein